MRVRDFGELQDHKLGLVQTYEKHTEHLRRHPAFVEAIDPVLRAELTDVMERMHAVMSENEVAINAARAANQRVATAIVNAVQDQHSDGAGYSAKGSAGKSGARPPVSLQTDPHLYPPPPPPRTPNGTTHTPPTLTPPTPQHRHT